MGWWYPEKYLNISPANQEDIVGEFAFSAREDVNKAVEAAKNGFWTMAFGSGTGVWFATQSRRYF